MTKKNGRDAKVKAIPPPPDPEEGYDALIAYFRKYDWDELERAGYLEKVPPKKERELVSSFTCDLLQYEGLTVSLAPKDCARLAELAAREDVSPEAIVKRWISEHLREEARPKRRKAKAS